MNIDDLFDRSWSKDYTCSEFVCEAWQRIVGEDLTQRFADVLQNRGKFKPITRPISPCIALFTNNSKSSTHVGLFYCDKILHLTYQGVQYVPLEFVAMNFRQVSFYE